MPKLRVGIADVLGAKPLAWGFLKGHHADLFTATEAPPAAIGSMLAEGNLDIALVPALELGKTRGLRVLPDLCVAAPARLRNALLVCRRPIADIRKVAIAEAGRTLQSVLSVVLADSYAISPDFLSIDRKDLVDPVLPAEADAAFLVGADAFRYLESLSDADDSGSSDSEVHQVHDLGAEWRRMTDSPLVLGVWAVRSGITGSELPFYFKSSLRYGLSSLDSVAREVASTLDVASTEIAEYFAEDLSFVLRRPERKALDDLLERAFARGLATHPGPVDVWAD